MAMPLSSYFPRTQPAVPMLARPARIPPDQPAGRGGGETVARQQRREMQTAPPDRAQAVAPETMDRTIALLRRLADGEVGGAMAAEARQVLSLLGAPAPQPADAGRVRLNIVA